MAVALNNSATGTTGGGTTVSFSYTVGSGSDRYLSVGCSNFGAVDITAVTYNSVACTSLHDSGSLSAGMEFWELVAPASGSNTLSFTLASYDPQGAKYSVADWTGVDQTTPSGAVVTSSGSGSGAGVVTTGSITCPSGGAVVGIGRHTYSPSPGLSVASGTTLGVTTAGSNSMSGAYRATTGSLSWTPTNSGNWRAVGLPINSTAAPSGFTAGATLGAVSGSGSLSSTASGFSAGATLGAVSGGGSLTSSATTGTYTSSVLTRNNGDDVGSATLTWVGFRVKSTGAPVLLKTTVSVTGGQFVVNDAALTPGATIRADWLESTGHQGWDEQVIV